MPSALLETGALNGGYISPELAIYLKNKHELNLFLQ